MEIGAFVLQCKHDWHKRLCFVDGIFMFALFLITIYDNSLTGYNNPTIGTVIFLQIQASIAHRRQIGKWKKQNQFK